MMVEVFVDGFSDVGSIPTASIEDKMHLTEEEKESLLLRAFGSRLYKRYIRCGQQAGDCWAFHIYERPGEIYFS